MMTSEALPPLTRGHWLLYTGAGYIKISFVVYCYVQFCVLFSFQGKEL